MLNTSPLTLNILAAAVWVLGGIVLLFKATELLAEASKLNPAHVWWPVIAAITGIVIGRIKAKFLFDKACKKNLDRIAALPNPKLWQFFRPGFFLALAIMIAAGATLSNLAYGNFPFLLAVATLDLTISVALLSSSIVFWQEKAFMANG